MKAAPKQSPAPVGSEAGTGKEGTHSSSPLSESTATAPWGPKVTTATGTRSASEYSAAQGSDLPVNAMASGALGRKA
ncbi:hypothetical protein PJL18_04077 [Paenarthrobacter nicotinovorans]|nr:hypothetical protein [Paenarthrobacter nicotinovorans]